MPNKSSFNSGRSGRIGGKSPNNSSITAGNFRGAGYSDADIISASRRNIGEEYNKFQDKLRKEFEQYLQNQKAERNISLEVVFILIENFLKERKAETQFKRQIENGRVAVNELLSNQGQLKELESNFQNKSSQKITLPKLIMTLATAALVFNQTDFKLENKPRSLDSSEGKDDFSDTLNKAGNALALGAVGGLVAGPIGAVAGASIGLIGGVEAKEQKTTKKTPSENKKQTQKKVGDEKFHQFWNGCADGELDYVRNTLVEAKKEGKLESLLTSLDFQNYVSPLYIAANLGKTEVVKEILAAVKDNPKLLEEILTQTNQEGESSLYMSADLGRTKVVEEILAAVKDKPKLLEDILKPNQKWDSPLYMAVCLGETEVVIKILAAVKDNPKLLEEILINKTNQKGNSSLYMAVYLGRTKVVEEILAAVKDKPDLLKEVLIKTNQEGNSPLYMAVYLSRTKVVEEILAAVKDNKGLLKELINHKPQEEQNALPSIVKNLLLFGNDEALKIILRIEPDLVTEKLPEIYFSALPKTAIYYLESFLKTDQSLKGNKIKYFEIDKNIHLNEIRLDPNNPNPTIVEVENGNKTRRVLLANDIEANDFKAESIKLKKAVEVANNKLSKTDIIIFNLGVKYSEIDRHALTIKLVRNNAKNGWNVTMHDPNSHLKHRPDSWKDINKQNVTTLCEEAGIKIIPLTPLTPLEEVKAIIPNHDNEDIDGSCDMISSIVAASMILGEDHSKQLREKCDEIGENCVEVLGSELNPEIDKILEARLQRIKNDLKSEKENDKTSNSAKKARAEKLEQKSVHNEL